MEANQSKGLGIFDFKKNISSPSEEEISQAIYWLSQSIHQCVAYL